MDPLAPEPFTRLVLLQKGMHLDLMRRRHYFRLLQQPFGFLAREITNADRPSFSLFERFFHGLPGVDEVGVAVHGFPVAVFGEHGFAAREGDGPVHEVEVYVVGAEVGEGGVEGGFDVGGVVSVVPEFGCDEDFGTGDTAFPYGAADGGFGAVAVGFVVSYALDAREEQGDEHAGGVDVGVAGFESFCHGVFLGVLVLPGTEAHGGYRKRGSVGGASGELGWKDIRISAPVLSLNLVLRVAMVRICGVRCLET